MKWTPEKIETAKRILGKYRGPLAMGNAILEMWTLWKCEFSEEALRRAFSRNGLKTPWSYTKSYNQDTEIVNSAMYGNVTKEHFLKECRTTFIQSVKSTTRIIVISDLHCPYHDKAAWECLLQVIRETCPNHVVIIGDFADCYSISSHPKSLKRRMSFAQEVEGVVQALRGLRKAAGDQCKVSWAEGNHEDRITRYLQSTAPELGGLNALYAEELFKVKELDIEWHPYRTSFKIGNCSFTHDVGRCGVNTARQSLIDFGGNIVVGHSHRGAVVYQGEIKGSSHFCLNVGWLGDVEQIDYTHRCRAKKDWQTGFGIVDQDKADFSWAQFVPILEGRCIVDGKLIEGRKDMAVAA